VLLAECSLGSRLHSVKRASPRAATGGSKGLCETSSRITRDREEAMPRVRQAPHTERNGGAGARMREWVLDRLKDFFLTCRSEPTD